MYRISKHYKFIFFIIFCYFACTTYSSAQTVVHLEPFYQRPPKQVEQNKIPDTPETPTLIESDNSPNIVEPEDTSKTVVPETAKNIIGEQNDSPSIVESGDSPNIIDKSDKISPQNDVIAEIPSDLNENDILAGTYFSNYRLVGPKTYTYFGDAGDMAGLSSVIRFSSYYKIISPDLENVVEVTLLKRRIAWALGVNTEYWFFLNYTLDCQPIVSDKKHPIIEFNKNGKITEKEIKTLSEYGSNRFVVIFSDAKKITDIIHSGANISILLPVLSGDYIRVPVPPKALLQWQEVVDIDLKELKKKHDPNQ